MITHLEIPILDLRYPAKRPSIIFWLLPSFDFYSSDSWDPVLWRPVKENYHIGISPLRLDPLDALFDKWHPGRRLEMPGNIDAAHVLQHGSVHSEALSWALLNMAPLCRSHTTLATRQLGCMCPGPERGRLCLGLDLARSLTVLVVLLAALANKWSSSDESL